MGVWIEEFKRLVRVFLKNYVVAWGIVGVALGCMFDNLAVFIPVCLCLGYYYEALYQGKGKN